MSDYEDDLGENEPDPYEDSDVNLLPQLAEAFALDFSVEGEHAEEYFKKVWFPDEDGKGGYLKVRLQGHTMYVRAEAELNIESDEDCESDLDREIEQRR